MRNPLTWVKNRSQRAQDQANAHAAEPPASPEGETTAGDLLTISIEGGPCEASDLLLCQNPQVLQSHGFDRAFWVVLDEGRVEESVGLLGHKEGKDLGDAWTLKMLGTSPSCDLTTNDAECLARIGNWIYVLGSHFGKKDGPLEAKRAFLARFCEADLQGKVHKAALPIEIARRPFVLHRAINDLFHESGFPLIPIGPHTRGAYLEKTLRKANAQGDPWAPDVRVEDWPLNMEGLALIGDRAFVGLRFPMSLQGEPILVEIEGILRLFEEGAAPPKATRAFALAGAGTRGRETGVRGLEVHGDALHIITGPIDSAHKGSSVTLDYPGSKYATCRHWRLSLASLPADSQRVQAELVRDFGEHAHIEGLCRGSEDDSAWYYIADFDERILLHIAQGQDRADRIPPAEAADLGAVRTP